MHACSYRGEATAVLEVPRSDDRSQDRRFHHLVPFSQRFIEDISWSSESQGAWYSEKDGGGENTNEGG
jgi:hypothetical protein